MTGRFSLRSVQIILYLHYYQSGPGPIILSKILNVSTHLPTSYPKVKVEVSRRLPGKKEINSKISQYNSIPVSRHVIRAKAPVKYTSFIY